MTFKELKDEIRFQLWPGGEQENLIVVHDAFFQQAMYDVCKSVPCYSTNQTTVFPQCATYFNCGRTVIPKPAGQVTELFVIDRINPETGEEDPTAEEDWCQKVHYQYVDYCHMSRYVQLCAKCSSSASSVDALVSALFGIFRRKRYYPRPTDEGIDPSLPPLPQGYKYPQASTNAGGRSPSGVFSIHHGDIHIAPWIQDTESVVVRHTGLKRQWGDADLVEEDPKFSQAIRLHVGHQHEMSYGDAAKARDYYEQLWGSAGVLGVIPTLIHQCREESRAADCIESGGVAGMARGVGPAKIYYNERVEYTASCPAGTTGNPVTVVREANTVPSSFSVADANARAHQQGSEEANNRLVCETVVVTYQSAAVTITVSCPGPDGTTPGATGTPITVTKPVGFKTSAVSQEDADALAETAALAEAGSALICTFYNAPQVATAECPEDCPEEGDEVERTVAAAVHSLSGPYNQAVGLQTQVNELALADAQEQAHAALDCPGCATVLVSNTVQTAKRSFLCWYNPQRTFTHLSEYTHTIPANTYLRTATVATQSQVQLELNNQAKQAAELAAQQMADSCQSSGTGFTKPCNYGRITPQCNPS